MESIESTHATGYYSLQYNWFQDFFGIYPFGRGIYPKIVGRYLDIRLCSIPTVGVYEKQGKLHLTRSTSFSLFFISDGVGCPRLFQSTVWFDRVMGDAAYDRRHRNQAKG